MFEDLKKLPCLYNPDVKLLEDGLHRILIQKKVGQNEIGSIFFSVWRFGYISLRRIFLYIIAHRLITENEILNYLDIYVTLQYF